MSALTRCACASILLVGALASHPAWAAGSEDKMAWIADSHGCKVANTFPRPGESITWSGGCTDGFANGDGVLQWFVEGRESDRFEGHLAMGWAEGPGTLAAEDGGKYVGEWKRSAQDGTGRYDAPDGSWYQGEWKHGEANGHGEYSDPDGKRYVGEWVNGVLQSGGPEDRDEDEAPDPNRT